MQTPLRYGSRRAVLRYRLFQWPRRLHPAEAVQIAMTIRESARPLRLWLSFAAATIADALCGRNSIKAPAKGRLPMTNPPLHLMFGLSSDRIDRSADCKRCRRQMTCAMHRISTMIGEPRQEAPVTAGLRTCGPLLHAPTAADPALVKGALVLCGKGTASSLVEQIADRASNTWTDMAFP